MDRIEWCHIRVDKHNHRGTHGICLFCYVCLLHLSKEKSKRVSRTMSPVVVNGLLGLRIQGLPIPPCPCETYELGSHGISRGGGSGFSDCIISILVGGSVDTGDALKIKQKPLEDKSRTQGKDQKVSIGVPHILRKKSPQRKPGIYGEHQKRPGAPST